MLRNLLINWLDAGCILLSVAVGGIAGALINAGMPIFALPAFIRT
jgi:hypothetical protein